MQHGHANNSMRSRYNICISSSGMLCSCQLPAAGAPRFIVDMTANRGNRTSMPCPASGPSRPCNNGTGSSRRYAMDLTGTDDWGPQQQHRPQPGTSVIEISSDSSDDDDDGDGPSGDVAHRPSTATAGRHDTASTRRRYRKGTDRFGSSCLHCQNPGWKLGCLGPAGERQDVVLAPARNRSLSVMWPDQHQQPPGPDDLQFEQFHQFQDFLAWRGQQQQSIAQWQPSMPGWQPTQSHPVQLTPGVHMVCIADLECREGCIRNIQQRAFMGRARPHLPELVAHVFVFQHSAPDGVRRGRPDWLSVQYKVSDDHKTDYGSHGVVYAVPLRPTSEGSSRRVSSPAIPGFNTSKGSLAYRSQHVSNPSQSYIRQLHWLWAMPDYDFDTACTVRCPAVVRLTGAGSPCCSCEIYGTTGVSCLHLEYVHHHTAELNTSDLAAGRIDEGRRVVHITPSVSGSVQPGDYFWLEDDTLDGTLWPRWQVHPRGERAELPLSLADDVTQSDPEVGEAIEQEVDGDSVSSTELDCDGDDSNSDISSVGEDADGGASAILYPYPCDIATASKMCNWEATNMPRPSAVGGGSLVRLQVNLKPTPPVGGACPCSCLYREPVFIRDVVVYGMDTMGPRCAAEYMLRSRCGRSACNIVYDGFGDGLFRHSSRSYFSLRHMYNFTDQFLTTGATPQAYAESQQRLAMTTLTTNTSDPKQFSVSTFRAAWYKFITHLDLPYKFTCPVCGTSPRRLICDGTAVTMLLGFYHGAPVTDSMPHGGPPGHGHSSAATDTAATAATTRRVHGRSEHCWCCDPQSRSLLRRISSCVHGDNKDVYGRPVSGELEGVEDIDLRNRLQAALWDWAGDNCCTATIEFVHLVQACTLGISVDGGREPREKLQKRALLVQLVDCLASPALTVAYLPVAAAEGRNEVYSWMVSYLEKAPDLVVYDFACNLHEYCMNRAPAFFQGTQFAVDRFHWGNHVSCSHAYNLSLFPGLSYINSEVAEQVNSELRPFKAMLSQMKQANFMACMRLALHHRNSARVDTLNRRLVYAREFTGDNTNG
ncbi:hypothetical protein VOLCADRAFT_100152 [Volvox carteri f. nagariensis]|uniref:HMG domain-containing protein n=1 Tax=Volvox carteri f. nagariensis TaxID=3068 RepID=D8UJJ3_VOLCA|nr:uncharacterized protein VOLCADRAFT_100152 [Volvox carteri f. nagariensis]EFJ40079.1 hypothetical protein VOLCADRAFT_100152 [Volvox carteri f. nagariensis]|eukprot:XP_002958828.1 hypothetical protein VOLCADRAFT_100152 [Volvox carteri f. nagariensis]